MTQDMVVIIDYGMGNLGSILNSLERIEVPAIISGKAKDIERADKLILPGVGFFATGMDNLKKSGLLPVLENKVCVNKAPILGICLGMQLFTKQSTEGNAAGLGWIDAETTKFEFDSKETGLRLPHTGWNSIQVVKGSPILAGLQSDAFFYFVHSYYVRCQDVSNVVATTFYGIEFASVIQKGNIFGTQFHPEKSHNHGVTVLKNFVENGC